MINQRPNVLLVDDQKLTHAIIGKALAEMDISLLSAYSGKEALNIVRDQDVSLVLMDLMMPGMNGIETASRIRSLLTPKLIPIIFITAASQDEDIVKSAYEMGAVDFLYKPVSPTILKAKTGVFTELHRQKMALEQRKEEYRDIIEAVATGIITLDMQWHIVEANDSACAQFQRERSALLGKHLKEILGDEDQDLATDIGSHLERNVAFAVRSIGHRADTSTFHADVRGTTVMLQGSPCVLMCVNDVSSYCLDQAAEAKQLLSTLSRPVSGSGKSLFEADSRQVNALLNALPLPVYFKNAHGEFINCNQSFLSLFHLERERVVGHTVHSLLPEDKSLAFEASDQALLSGHAPSRTLRVDLENTVSRRLRLEFHKAAFETEKDLPPSGIVGIITRIEVLDDEA